MGSVDDAAVWYEKSDNIIKQHSISDEDVIKQLYSRKASLLYEKSRRCFNSQKYVDGLKFINQALEFHITKDKLYLKGSLLVQLKMPEKAVEVYRDILKKDPNDYSANEFMNQFAGKS